MKKSVHWLIAMALLVVINACQNDEINQSSSVDIELVNAILSVSETSDLSYFQMPQESELDQIPQDPKNPLTEEKLELGKLLFHETGLGQNPAQEMGRGTYSCASCHHVAGGFQADRFQGLGEGGLGFGDALDRVKHNLYQDEQLDVQPIRTPSALNSAYQINMLWNGQFGATGLNQGTESSWTSDTPKEKNHLGFEGVETQAIAGMDVHRLVVTPEIVESLGYKQMFDKVFSNSEEDERYTSLNAGLAIAAYERSLLASEAPFQKWLRGEFSAMSTSEKEGALLFFGKAKCVNCHSGPSLANMEFHAIGMNDLFLCPQPTFKTKLDNIENLGRGGFTNKDEDMYAFKVPQLYNLKDSPFYGHGSSFNSITEVIDYKNQALAQNSNVPEEYLSPLFVPLNLSEEEVNKLAQFINSALYDDNLQRYAPIELPSGNCFPNADRLAKVQLGCE